VRAAPSTRWVVLGVALAIQTSTSIVASALPVLLPLLKAEFHLTFAAAGLLSNFSFLGAFLTIAAAGWAVDALGDRFVLVLGGLVAGGAALLSAVVPSFSLILVVLLLMGAGTATSTPAGSIAVRTAFPLRMRGMVMSLRQTGIPLGGFFAALILPSIALAGGWRAAIAAAGAASIAAALVGLAIYRSGPRPVQAEGDSGSLLRVMTRDLRIAAVGGMLLVAGQMSLLTYVVTYLIHDRGLAITTAALLLALAQLGGVTGRVLWGVVSDRLLGGRRRSALLLAAGTGALASLVLSVLPGSTPLPLLVAVVVACAVGAVGWNGVQISFLSELARPGSEGRAVGLALMIQQPGILAGPFLFGLMVDLTGSFRPAWLLLAGFLGLAMLVMLAVHEPPIAISPPLGGGVPAKPGRG
jgi:MFS family permease